MSMSKEECLHDCTCPAHGLTDVGPDADWFDCELPEGHVGPHWDQEHGFFGQPVL